MAKSRRGRRKRRALIEGVLITGIGVLVMAVFFVIVTRTMVDQGSGSRIRLPASAIANRAIR